jgi:serine/threonine protein kinase
MSIIPRRLDKYELVECLGRGSAAEVWKALDTHLQRFVGIKMLCPNLHDDPTFLVRFQREAQFIASLHHPNIVQIHDFQVLQSTPSDQNSIPNLDPVAYMVMDYIEGSTLADYIGDTSKKEKFPSPTELVNLFTSISLAIDYAHGRGMIHRDIKPANILLDQRNTIRNPMGEPILADFGIAKLLNASLTTQTGLHFGTPAYTSPEQIRGYSGNERSDLYSLAVILYEIVTGVVPFQGTPIEIMTQLIRATPTSPTVVNPKVPPALSEVIMRGLANNLEDRFISAAAMTVAVAYALDVPVPEILGQPSEQPVMQNEATNVMLIPSPQPTGQSIPTQSQESDTSDETLLVSPIPRIGQTGRSAPVTPVLRSSRQAVSLLAALSTIPALKKIGLKGRIIDLIAVILVVCLVAGLAIFLYVPALLAPTNAIVGQAFYTSSGQRTTGTAQGIADQMLIDLQNIPPAQAGKSYYAWLLGDKVKVGGDDMTGLPSLQPPILLTNNLSLDNGKVHYLFPGNALHTNLLSRTSRLLITEENANQSPRAPSTDPATWRYFAMIPQQPIPGDPAALNALNHIRHLFSNESHTKMLGLPGGLDFWLSRNTEKVLEWSVTARDDWNGTQTSDAQIDLMRPMFVRILDYLDGKQNVHVDVLPDTPLLTDPTDTSVALLTVDPLHQDGANQATNPQGYVDNMQLDVEQVAHAPDVSPDIRLHASHSLTGLRNAGGWLAQVRKDAIALFNMGNRDPMQLRQPEANRLLDDMVTQATYAYIGQLDPVTNQIRPGVIQVHHDNQKLAVLSITSDLPSSL